MAHPSVKIPLRGVHKYSKSLKVAKISIKISLKFIFKKQNTMDKPWYFKVLPLYPYLRSYLVEARGHVHPLFLYGTDYIFYYYLNSSLAYYRSLV